MSLSNESNGVCKTRSVAIIGAGAAGLCALRNFLARPDLFGPVVCYEQTDLIGGTWNYTDQIGLDKNGLPVLTSMYQDLRTNAPSQIMVYPDFPNTYSKSFPESAEVLDYIHKYANHFALRSNIRFEHHIKHLTRDNQNDCWLLTVWDIRQDRVLTLNYDIVILCPGRACIPIWPKIDSMHCFKGDLIHVHDYRSRHRFAGKRVAVIGAGPSGFDMVIQTSSVATQVIFINRTSVQFENLPFNVVQIKANVSKFGIDCIQVQFTEKANETCEYQVDAVIIATGYRIYLDYVDMEQCGLHLNTDNDTLDGIYRHLINIKYPTMALLSIIRPSINLPLYHYQLLYYIKLLSGEISFPTEEQMNADVAAELVLRREMGICDSDRHLIKIPLMRKYFEQLVKDAKLEPPWNSMFDLMDEVAKSRRINPLGYKEINYKLIDANHLEII